MFYQTYTARKAVEITHGSDGMVPSALHDVIVICSERVPFRHCRGRGMGVDSTFLSLVTLTFDLDIQTRPSEGPNASSL